MLDQLKNFMLDPDVERILLISVGIFIIWFLVKGIQKKLLWKLRGRDNYYRAKKISSFIGYLISLVLIGVVYSDKLGGISVALGVAGAGIAFSLQEVISSFAGWLSITFLPKRGTG